VALRIGPAWPRTLPVECFAVITAHGLSSLQDPSRSRRHQHNFPLPDPTTTRNSATENASISLLIVRTPFPFLTLSFIETEYTCCPRDPPSEIFLKEEASVFNEHGYSYSRVICVRHPVPQLGDGFHTPRRPLSRNRNSIQI
jgi:hypothetical protein